ncbi:hypothetical protein [Pedobacter caeni]|uniref:hypothetical protein n=1 Tax=Pedobacter caeni TaxID=288992 RepID=UPI0011611B0F|nr:hypothetical protein [Pedobacter caeni]
MKGNQFQYYSQLTDELINVTDFLIGLGKQDIIESPNENIEPLDSMGLVDVYYETLPDSSKIVNSLITWKTTYKDANAIGSLLKKSNC